MADQTLPPQPPDPPYYSPPPVPEQPKRRLSGSLVAAIVGGALLLIVVTIVVTVMVLNPATTSGTKPPTKPVGKSVQAAQLCQQAVLDRLKSPATASFSNVTAELFNQTYTVKGSVDSQNSFGGLARSDWSCEIFAGGDGLATPNITSMEQRG